MGSDKRRYQRISPQWHRSLAEYFEQLPAWISQKENIPTIRRATELPYHLAWGGRADHLADLILGYELLETILFGMGPQIAIEDITLVLSPPVIPDRNIPENQVISLTLIQGAIRLSSHILEKDLCQLTTHLWGRLQGYREPAIAQFLDLVSKIQIIPWARLTSRSFATPSGLLIQTLRGHTDGVKGIVVTPDGQNVVSGSLDKTLKVWDL